MIRTTFVMEQHIGHMSFYLNMRRSIDPAPEVKASWVPVTYTHDGNWLNRVPLPSHIRGTLIGRQQVLGGLQKPYDIAVFNTQVPASLGLRALGRRDYILCTDITPIQYDDMGEHYGHKPDRFQWLANYKHRANTRLFQNARRILPWSSWTAQSLVDDYGVNPSRIEVMPPGVEISMWQPDVAQRGDKPRVLFVGGDFYRKGGQQLLDAFRRLPAGSAELHIVTRSQIAPEDNVFVYNNMQPNSAELIALYQRCNIFSLPTRAEAFGIVAIEASAMSMPVLATKVGGLVDIVDEGKTGYLIPPNDVDTLADRLRTLVDNPQLCHDMGSAARARVLDRFDATRNGRRFVEILQEVWQEAKQ